MIQDRQNLLTFIISCLLIRLKLSHFMEQNVFSHFVAYVLIQCLFSGHINVTFIKTVSVLVLVSFY
jgi:hypothetical protein